MDSLRLYGLVATGGVVLLSVYALLRRKPKTPEDIERGRRAWLEVTGRITDGTVIDVQELAAANNHHAAVMLIYKYDVAGVSYECSQDVTYLRHWINLHSCRLGLQTSVKYDPQNPGNSLVVSENWMGLRQQTLLSATASSGAWRSCDDRRKPAALWCRHPRIPRKGSSRDRRSDRSTRRGSAKRACLRELSRFSIPRRGFH